MKTIIVVRHGERLGSKDGRGGADKLSPKGFMQMAATGHKLRELGLHCVSHLLSSGADRATQGAGVLQLAMELNPPLKVETVLGLNFTRTLTTYLKDTHGFYAEVDCMKAAEGGVDALTVEMALRHSDYARDGRRIMTDWLVEFADSMWNGQLALCVSHSPWSELAAVEPASMPYGIGEADAVVYQIGQDNYRSTIVQSTIIPCPVEGYKHT